MDSAVLTGVRSTHTQDMPAQRSPDLSRSKRRCNGTASCTASTIVHRVGSPGRGRASAISGQACACTPHDDTTLPLPSSPSGAAFLYSWHCVAILVAHWSHRSCHRCDHRPIHGIHTGFDRSPDTIFQGEAGSFRGEAKGHVEVIFHSAQT